MAHGRRCNAHVYSALRPNAGFFARGLICAQTCGRPDVLKVGHHGSAYSSSMQFIVSVHPRYAIVSMKGADDTAATEGTRPSDTDCSKGCVQLLTIRRVKAPREIQTSRGSIQYKGCL